MKLEEQIKTHIKHHGYMTVMQYMKWVADSYYAQNDPLGRRGDFITAPEISQIFGELIGLWLASNWVEMGSPRDTILVELGAGRGTLLNDLLRATKKVPDFHANITVHIVEINATLRQLQKQLLEPHGITLCWHDDISTLPDQPIIWVANEFFDALPIHQFIKKSDGWRERTVTMDQQQRLVFGITEIATPHTLFAPKEYQGFLDGAIYEYSPESNIIIQQLSQHMTCNKGAGIVIDYGYWKGGGTNTFQAIKSHAYHNPLADIGHADVTAHVNFKQLANTAIGAGGKAYLGVTQGMFLEAMGVNIRASILDKSGINDCFNDVKRLVDPYKMGELFKCLAITDKDLSTPYGFGDTV